MKHRLFLYRNYLQGLFLLIACVSAFPVYPLRGSQRDILAAVGGVGSLMLSAMLYIWATIHREDVRLSKPKRDPVSKGQHKLILLEGGEL